MPAPFNKGAYWCGTSAPLVKGGTPPKAEGGFRPPSPLPPPLGEVPPQGAERVSPAKKKSPGGGLGIDFFPYHVILKIKRGAAGRREPPFTKRSNRTVGTVGRLLLFPVQEQVNDTNDQDADLNEIRIRDHLHHPLLCSGGGKKLRPPPEEGASRLPNTGSASAYPCAEDIIARFVEFGNHNFDMF